MLTGDFKAGFFQRFFLGWGDEVPVEKVSLLGFLGFFLEHVYEKCQDFVYS